VLGIDRIPRLIYQPDEAPSEPIAMPYAEPLSALEARGGTLPSLADSTSAGPAGAIATDASSLAHWWEALCSTQLVSPDSLAAMSRDVATGERIDRYGDGHGLGLTNMTGGYTRSFGYGGYTLGYLAWAACLPASGSVVVVLTNATEVPDEWPRPLVIDVESP
jgi:CubicO group peptidase (beta-lactamase class C family)